MSNPNDRQVGGDHYRHGGEQHWDRMWRLHGRGYFVGCATKYVERYHEKNGKQDLEKAIHFIEKLISLEYPERDRDAEFFAEIARANERLNAARFNPEYAPLASFPKPTYPHVKPTGWIGFTFEGSTKDWFLFTCKNCKAEVRADPETDPHDYHDCQSVKTDQ